MSAGMTLIGHLSARGLLAKMPGVIAFQRSGWDRIHPFDCVHGADTSGFVGADKLPESESARTHAVCYAGSQPSVLRLALAQLPTLDSFTLLDLGCGKGRPLLVASEFPFRDILSVERSSSLAEIARRNASIVAQRFLRRTAVRIAVADASTFPLTVGDLYHPFGAELIAKLVAGVEAALSAERRSIYVVYDSPVAGHCFDASPLLRRRFARLLSSAAEERGYGPDEADPLMILQSGLAPCPAVEANARIVLEQNGMRVVLEYP